MGKMKKTYLEICKPCSKNLSNANAITVFGHVVKEHVSKGECVRWQYRIAGITGGFYDSPRDAFEAGFKSFIEQQVKKRPKEG